MQVLGLNPNSDENGKPIPYMLNISPDAMLELNTFTADIERPLCPGANHAPMADWAGKLTGPYIVLPVLFTV